MYGSADQLAQGMDDVVSNDELAAVVCNELAQSNGDGVVAELLATIVLLSMNGIWYGEKRSQGLRCEARNQW